MHAEYLSTDPEVVKRVQNSGKRIVCTPPQMHAMLERGKKLVVKEHVEQFVDRPVAVFHGTGDKVNDFKGTFEFYELAQVRDKKLYRYPDFYHDFFHETQDRVREVMRDIKAWLTEHTTALGGVREAQAEFAQQEAEADTVVDKAAGETEGGANVQTA